MSGGGATNPSRAQLRDRFQRVRFVIDPDDSLKWHPVYVHSSFYIGAHGEQAMLEIHALGEEDHQRYMIAENGGNITSASHLRYVNFLDRIMFNLDSADTSPAMIAARKLIGYKLSAFGDDEIDQLPLALVNIPENAHRIVPTVEAATHLLGLLPFDITDTKWKIPRD